LSPLSNST